MKRLLLTSNHLNETYLKLDTFDEIILLEIKPFYSHFKYHKNRLVLHISALRHFFNTYSKDYTMRYVKIDDIESFIPFDLEDTYIIEPVDYMVKAFFKPFTNLKYIKDPHVLSDSSEISLWKKGKSFKMEHFYIFMRHKFQLLLVDGKPIGSKYSFDSSNRKPFKKGLPFSPHMTFSHNAITLETIQEVQTDYKDHPGDVQYFNYPVSRQEALDLLDHALLYHLKTFGDYQDVMIQGNPNVSHTLLSSSINIGLLSPLEVIHKAIQMYESGLSDLESTEGFVRQILGWREYIRLMYIENPDYHTYNFFNHTKKLPDFYWDANTDLNCLREVIGETIQYGYNHHIQRLMILGNYANLIGINPKEVNDWFNTMYIDSFDWVVTPNVIGMALYADGGLMSTKPYISSAAYIHKMSNYCESCKYDPKIKEGPKACPFNALYWNFIDTHEDTLKDNPRMSMMVSTKRKMDSKLLETYKKDAKAHINRVT